MRINSCVASHWKYRLLAHAAGLFWRIWTVCTDSTRYARLYLVKQSSVGAAADADTGAAAAVASAAATVAVVIAANVGSVYAFSLL